MGDGAWLVVGLGNPGPEYAGNRHSVGQRVVDELAARAGATLAARGRSGRAQAAVAEIRVGVLPGGLPGPRAVLARPTTYMNASGGPVAALVRRLRLEPDRVIVVHDDLDLPFGAIRIKRGGGEGGHNGLRDITRALGTQDYLRVRVGIGRPPGRMDAADYVLRDFAPAERRELPMVLSDAADAVQLLVTDGLERAQNTVHTRS